MNVSVLEASEEVDEVGAHQGAHTKAEHQRGDENGARNFLHTLSIL